MYTVLTLGTGATIAGALYSDYVSGNGGVAMLASALGLLLSSLAFMERVNIDASDALYIDRRASNFVAFLHVLLIMLVLAVIMISAPLVDWFNYYIVKQSFDIGPIRIPRLYLSLVMPVVTSVALILFTSYGDLKNSVKRLELARVSGENWKIIWQQKEETVSKLASNVSLKIFIFLVTISFAVISTTQIGRYTEQGMLVLLPFIITWLGVFLVNAIAAASHSTVKDALKSWLIEKTKQCVKCKATNLFESQFCTACGSPLSEQTIIVEETVECNRCKERSPAGSKYCRSCGVTF
jgi:ribosomal protein L40E